MNNKKLRVLLMLIVIALPTISLAENSSDGNAASSVVISSSSSLSKKEARQNTRGEIKDARIQAKNSIKEAKMEARENAKKVREEFRGEVKGIRATSTLSADEKRGKIEEEWKEKQKNLEKIRKERGKKAQEIGSNTQKTILEKRETLKIDLKKIKDERKSQIVEKTDKKLEKINDGRANHLLDVLNNLEKTLAKINIRISAAQTKGIDVSSAKKASDDAAKAITAARTAVEAQAAKVYKMTITDENKLKADVGNTIKKLQDDLKQIRIVVQSAHDAVRKAAMALVKAMRVEDKPKSSSSASTSSVASSQSSS